MEAENKALVEKAIAEKDEEKARAAADAKPEDSALSAKADAAESEVADALVVLKEAEENVTSATALDVAKAKKAQASKELKHLLKKIMDASDADEIKNASDLSLAFKLS